MGFLSRLGSRNRSSMSISTKIDPPPPPSRTHSVPTTPHQMPTAVKHSVSIPALAPRDDMVLLSPSSLRPAETFPLCVARLQAIHAVVLSACHLSSEIILKRSSEKAGMSTKEKRARPWGHASTRSADLQWTRKLFVLVPGFLLQYAGDATEDRIPEKVLQLSPTTLAYASDAIENRPWVLCVYGNAADDLTAASEREKEKEKEKKGRFISKVTFKSHVKSSASALLLVFEGAEEMDTWMGLIRCEARRLAGGIVGEALTPSTDEPPRIAEETQHELQIEEPDTRRNLINRDEHDTGRIESSSDDNPSRRTSTYHRSSTDAGQSVGTAVSGDQITLDQLRGRSRLSVHSGSGRARVPTVSPDTSPERGSSISAASKARRRSTALSAHSHSSVDLRPSSRRLSVIDRDSNMQWPRTPSPPTTGFSAHSGRLSPLPPPPPDNSVPPVPPTPTSISNMWLPERSSKHRPRPVSTISNPSQSSVKKSPKDGKRRPVSMIDTRAHPHYHHHYTPSSSSVGSESPSSRIGSRKKKTQSTLPLMIPGRNRSLKRRSLGALSVPPEDCGLNTETAGPAPHPPPNIPLPEIPDLPPIADADLDLLSRSLSGPVFRRPSTSNGIRRASRSDDRTPRVLKQPNFRKLANGDAAFSGGPASAFTMGTSVLTLQDSASSSERKTENRHSFHGLSVA